MSFKFLLSQISRERKREKERERARVARESLLDKLTHKCRWCRWCRAYQPLRDENRPPGSLRE